MHLLGALLCCTLYVILTSGGGDAAKLSVTAKDAVSRVPKEDLGLFIRYHLSKGSQQGLSGKSLLSFGPPVVPQEKLKIFQDIPTPENFSDNLTQWTKHQFNLTDTEVRGLVASGVICFPTGCINANDIGSLCCPF